MKRSLAMVCLAAALLMAGTAQADSIKGRFGITGKFGFVSPNDSDIGDGRIKPDIGFIGGGGFIYGIDDHVAAELDITHSSFGSDFPMSGNAGDFDVTNIAVGAQYRFAVPQRKLVPYVGAGLDFLLADYQYSSIDTTVGVHFSAGADYFVAKSVALTAEAKAVIAPETNIRNYRGSQAPFTGKQGNFDPSNFSTTFGFRIFF